MNHSSPSSEIADLRDFIASELGSNLTIEDRSRAFGRKSITWKVKTGSGDGEFTSLGFGGIAVDLQGNVFVVDNGNFRIQKFDLDGNFLTAWGSEGTDDGQFVRAIGIAVDADGNVYVTDDENPFVQKFDNDGRCLLRGGP